MAASPTRGFRPGGLLPLTLAAGGLLLFLRVADEMGEGATQALDGRVLLALRVPGDPAQPIGPAWLLASMIDLSALGGVTVLTLMTVVVAGYLLSVRARGEALFLAASVLGGTLVSTLLKQAFARPRPDVVVHLQAVSSGSFPSGHALLSAVVWLTLGALLLQVAPTRLARAYIMAACIGVALLVGVSRIYLGVHWPTDVLAGWAIGGAWAILCWWVAQRFLGPARAARATPE